MYTCYDANDIYVYVYMLIVMPSESFSLSLHLGPFVTFIVGVGTPSFNLPRCTRRRWSAWTARQKRSNSPGKETACVSTSYANHDHFTKTRSGQT